MQRCELVAGNIRLGRRLAGLSQGELARRLGADRRHVSRWERAAHEPGEHSIVALAAALEQPLGFFYAERSAALLERLGL